MPERTSPNDDDGGDEHEPPEDLPAPYDAEHVSRLKEARRALDGPMSVSNANVPEKAHDIGDADVRPNPRASDLEYPEAAECSIGAVEGTVIMWDEENSQSKIRAKNDAAFIDRVSEWA